MPQDEKALEAARLSDPRRCSVTEQPLPPEGLLGIVGGSSEQFTKHGQKWLRYFKESCELEPHAHVLDVGCGLGSVAIPLGGYLTPQGRYEGFDIVPGRINWCTQNITRRWPNFRFQLADIFSSASNPGGRIRAKDYTFPYGDEEFDFVFLISVFTHMLPEDVERYLTEITRVLKKGGRCLGSYLLLNDESLRFLEAGKSRLWVADPEAKKLPHDFGEYRLASKKVPELMVAYREGFVLDLYEKVGLQIRGHVHYGGWVDREPPEASEALFQQDWIVADLPGDDAADPLF